MNGNNTYVILFYCKQKKKMYNSLILPITNKGAIYAGFAPRANNMWLWCRDLLRLDCDGVTFDILSQKHVAFWAVTVIV